MTVRSGADRLSAFSTGNGKRFTTWVFELFARPEIGESFRLRTTLLGKMLFARMK